jgi:hypothetical protein
MHLQANGTYCSVTSPITTLRHFILSQLQNVETMNVIEFSGLVPEVYNGSGDRCRVSWFAFLRDPGYAVLLHRLLESHTQTRPLFHHYY